MKKIIFLSTLLFLAACASGAMPIDPEKLLNSMAGPKVPTVEDTLQVSAKKAEDLGNFKQAATYYQQMLEKKPDDKDIAFSLAEDLRRSGELDKAIILYDKIIAKDPKMVAAKESKGLALIAKGDFKAPIPLFDEIMAADPTRWKTLNAMGILFSIRNKQPEAEQYFNAALKYKPDSASIYNNLGLAQALNRKFDDAISSLQKASSLTTTERKRIDLNLALVFASAGKLDDAKAIAMQYFQGAALDNNLGLYAHLAKDDQLARAYLNTALTESKVYYAKAWDNLQDISASGNDSNIPTDPTPDTAKNVLPEPSNGKDPISPPSQPPLPPKAAASPLSQLPPGVYIPAAE